MGRRRWRLAVAVSRWVRIPLGRIRRFAWLLRLGRAGARLAAVVALRDLRDGVGRLASWMAIGDRGRARGLRVGRRRVEGRKLSRWLERMENPAPILLDFPHLVADWTRLLSNILPDVMVATAEVVAHLGSRIHPGIAHLSRHVSHMTRISHAAHTAHHLSGVAIPGAIHVFCLRLWLLRCMNCSRWWRRRRWWWLLSLEVWGRRRRRRRRRRRGRGGDMPSGRRDRRCPTRRTGCWLVV